MDSLLPFWIVKCIGVEWLKCIKFCTLVGTLYGDLYVNFASIASFTCQVIVKIVAMVQTHKKLSLTSVLSTSQEKGVWLYNLLPMQPHVCYITGQNLEWIWLKKLKLWLFIKEHVKYPIFSSRKLVFNELIVSYAVTIVTTAT